MIYSVDGWNNFCRVFEIPETYPEEYLFGGGKPVEFLMVDWFNPVPGIGQPAVSKEVWRKEVGEIEVKEISLDWFQESLVPWLLTKSYIKPGRDYLILCDFGAALQFRCPE